VREERRKTLLYQLNAALVGDVTLDSILNRVVERVVSVYGATRSRLLLPEDDDELAIKASYPPGVLRAIASKFEQFAVQAAERGTGDPAYESQNDPADNDAFPWPRTRHPGLPSVLSI